MTKAHKIYVVIGRSGEYSDRSEWPVCWRHTMEDAQAMVDVLTQQASQYQAWSRREVDGNSGRYSDEDNHIKSTMLDSYFSHDYHGTDYSVWAISDDPADDVVSRSLRGDGHILKDKMCMYPACKEDGHRIWDNGPQTFLCDKHYKGAEEWFFHNKKHALYAIDVEEYFKAKDIDQYE